MCTRETFRLSCRQWNRRHLRVSPAYGHSTQLQDSSGQLAKGDIVSADCVGLAHQRQGVCMLESNGRSLPTFVDGAVPGERLTLQLTKVKRSFAQGKKVAVVTKPRHSIQAPCSHFGVCGGCSLQELPYHLQLQAKENRLLIALERSAARWQTSPQDVYHGIAPCASQYRYRNKMSFSLTKSGPKCGSKLGMQLPRSNDTLAIHSCLLQSSTMDALIAPINQALQESSERLAQHASYFIKRIVLREGFRTAQEAKACSLRGDVPVSNPVIWDQPNVDELSAESESFSRNTDCRAAAERDGRVVLMNIITNGRGDKRQLQLLYSIVEATKEIADVAGAVQTIHTEQSLASPAQSAVCIRGQDHLFEAIGHVIVKVSALSFLQVNTQQCVSLLAAVSRAAKLQKHEKVLDLYCGAGTIALWLAREASSVLGFEWCRAAIADARSNAALNGIKHVRFEWGDLECLGSRGGGLQRQLEGIDVVVVDPPRSGLSAEVMRLLSSCSARTVVYVSCWPASLCRDIAAFQASGWSCVSVTGVDMFPQTEHLETVAALERK